MRLFRERIGEQLAAQYQRINSRKTLAEKLVTSEHTPIAWSARTTSIAPAIGNLTGVSTLIALAVAYVGDTSPTLMVIPLVGTPLLLVPLNVILIGRVLQDSLDRKN